MMRPLLVFPDPVVVTLGVLRGAFLALPEVAATGVTISHAMPARTADTIAPSILVADDGDAYTGSWPVHEDALMRVTVWDRSPFRAARLARLARAYLLADPGSPISRGFRAGARPFPSTDPDDATPLASFTITARLRAE